MGENETANSTAEPESDESTFTTSKHLPYVILCIFIVLTNTFVILLFSLNKYLRKPHNYLLVSLNISDLLYGLIGLPLALVCSTRPVCLACTFSHPFVVFTSCSTVLHILIISYERYLKIVFPFRLQQIGRARFEVKVVACIWFISIAIPTLPFIWLPVDDKSCDEDLTDEQVKLDKIYQISTMALFVGLPVLLLVYADAKVFFVVRRQLDGIQKTTVGVRDSQKRLKKEIRVLVLFAVMMLYFVISWSFYYAAIVIHSFLQFDTKFPQWFVDLVVILRCSTSLVNPILYILLKHDFRRVVRHGICRFLNKYLGNQRESSVQDSNGGRTSGGQTDSRNATERTSFF